MWPVRNSLFPHVPPYILFNTHNSDVPFTLPIGQKYLKWKLSRITPFIVKNTLTNSGFYLVRSEFSRGLHPFPPHSYYYFCLTRLLLKLLKNIIQRKDFEFSLMFFRGKNFVRYSNEIVQIFHGIGCSVDSNEWSGTWGKHMRSHMFKTLKDTQKLNHFPGTFQIGRKDRLWRNLQRLTNKFGQQE